MKTTILKKGTIAFAIILLVLCALGAVLRAQTETQTTDAQTITDSILQPVAPGSIPDAGTFFRLSDYLEYDGKLGPPWPSLSLISSNATVYALNQGAFLVDDASITNDQALANALELLAQPQDAFSAKFLTSGGTMMAADSIDPTGGDTNSTGTVTNYAQYTPFVPPTNGLWIEVPTNSLAAADQFSVILHNTIQDAPYDVLTSTNLALPLSEWTVEQTMLGVEGTNGSPVSLIMNGRANLFVDARFGGSSASGDIPDWWQQQYFGTNSVAPYAQDSSGDGWTYVQDYQNGFIPGSWHTPPAPTGLAVQYNASTGAATVSWSPSPGPVQGYTVQKWTLQTFTTTNMDFPAGTTSFPDTVPTTPDGPFFGNSQQIFVRYSVQAHYPNGDSDWSPQVPLQPTFDPNDALISILSAQMVIGQQNQTYVAASGLPSGVTGIRVTRVDTWDFSFNTNLDIPISNVMNGVCPLPSWLASSPIDGDGYNSYEWYLQTLDANNNPSAPISLGFGPSLPQSPGFTPLAQPNGASDSSGQFPFYFYDGRQQMKQNLDFLLRAATLAPFNYLAYPSNSTSSTHFSYPSNYVYAGLYQPYDATSLSDEGLVDAFRPFEENYLFHNFVFTQSDLDSNGELTTGANGGSESTDYSPYNPNLSIAAPFLQYPVTYEFQTPTTPGSIPAILDAGSDAQYTYFFPLDTKSDLDAINVTSVSGTYYMTNNTVNYFGLPYDAALFATNNNGFTLLNPGGNIPAVGGFAYPKAALPGLTNVDYYFSEPSMFGNQQPLNLIPGNAAFSVTNTTPLLFAGFGEPIQIAGYSKEQLINGYPGVYAYLGQYFQGAYIIDTNGMQTTNSAGIISPYGTFLATNVGPAALVTMPNWGESTSGTGVVNVIKLQLDVNHDGIMDLSFGGPDNTSAASPFVFWVNNDYDRLHDVDCTPIIGGNCDSEEDDLQIAGSPGTVGGNTPDCDYQWSSGAYAIPCKRDLEDYTRLWMPGIKALYEAHPNLTFELSIQNNDTDDGPAINLYLAAESDGGTAYLTNTTVADEQITSPSAKSLGRLTPNSPIRLNDYFNLLLPSGTGAEKFIWCGASRGKGELVLQIKDGTNVVGETSAWIQLKDVKEMYERWTVGDAWNYPPFETATNAVEDLPQGVSPFQYDLPTSTNTPYILLVHGWNMQRWEKDRFAETAFKRLYWQGYQGRFGFFRWPTLYSFPLGEFSSQAIDPDNYDESEWAAWRSATPLRKLLMQLDTEYAGNVHLMAHSMGNVVAGEALRTNTPLVRTYIAMEAAIPSHCYDPNATQRTIPFLLDSQTPNRYAEYWTNGAPCYFDGAMGAETYVNFFNTNDYALNAWQTDQDLKPDTGLGFGYDSNTNQFLGDDLNTALFFPQDTYQIFAFCDEARCFALGAQPDVGGVFATSQQVDLASDPYDFSTQHKYHSGQFRSNNMARWQFWDEALIKMSLKGLQ
ncbi:MAG TPA: alpha/beta hydrolase [Candidatus Angelobacter sp.]|nr:alpha/beta hydrolase [Candidatus Angelobacter sp.]